MKLLYLWVQQYHNIFQNKEFHFSDEYHFHFDHQTNTLDCRRNDRYPAEIYPTQNVGQISCVIGNNGQGKTTLLKLLMTVLPAQGGLNDYGPIPCVYALKADEGDDEEPVIWRGAADSAYADSTSDRIYIYTSLEQIRLLAQSDVNIVNSTDSVVFRLPPDAGHFLRCKEMKHTAVIFHSNIFDRDRYNTQERFHGVEDISFNGLLRTDFEFRTTHFDVKSNTQLRTYLDADMLRQIHFISDFPNRDYKHWISFQLPRELKFVFLEETDMLNFVYHHDLHTLSADETRDIYRYEKEFANNRWFGYTSDQLEEIAAHICRDIVNQYHSLFRHDKNRFRYLINCGILMSVLRCVFPETVGANTFQTLKSLIFDLRGFLISDAAKRTIAPQISDFRDDSLNFVVELIRRMKLEDMDGLLDAVKRLNHGLLNGENGIINVINDGFYMEVHSREQMLTDFYKDIRKTALGYDYLTFRWNGLSSGEYNLLSLYARIYSLQEKLQDYSSLMFLIDEADLSYHPKWQQEYVCSLVSFLNHVYPHHQIQLIIATHSPIILSDVLKGNVVFLNDKGETNLENTFGANIYDLYRNGMFLDKGQFGVVGAYAVQKIQETEEMLDRCDYSPNDIGLLGKVDKLVDCIGEPVLKRMLTHRIDLWKEQLFPNERKEGEEAFSLVQENLKKLDPEFLEKAAHVIEELRGK